MLLLQETPGKTLSVRHRCAEPDGLAITLDPEEHLIAHGAPQKSADSRINNVFSWHNKK